MQKSGSVIKTAKIFLMLVRRRVIQDSAITSEELRRTLRFAIRNPKSINIRSSDTKKSKRLVQQTDEKRITSAKFAENRLQTNPRRKNLAKAI